ncbi:phosphoribosylformylglycinamidine synthase [Desulfonispora thiosulfatigenes DSM 11270]|uniref:Phosphoribosylformylglycinamidine synthase subunit PurS n=1 Tax=Desulfonispora thiosulfatigenes DSM 11270 TaxID=656914 RepID=A0A1W1VDT0_DESTI|nr:phosphoribosylformylglycinamidine synthase subunit PurS [Desulfonispora thiosulfatigenes]SMB91597.1 phosphoribosylformylglycinamidine synthase [Desulfonispora thiosulfatigenes DSM 11270]
MFKALIHITLKESILDPQGSAVKKGLESLGFSDVTDVRVGKYLEISLEASGKSEAENKVLEMCKKLLANPVIENYEYELVEG